MSIEEKTYWVVDGVKFYDEEKAKSFDKFRPSEESIDRVMSQGNIVWHDCGYPYHHKRELAFTHVEWVLEKYKDIKELLDE